MKQAIKIYETIVHPILYTSVMVNGKRVKLEFTGHQRAPKFVMGRVVVSKPEVQKAIEEDPRYGVQFKLKRTEWVEVREPQKMMETEPLKGVNMFTPAEVKANPGQSKTEEPKVPEPAKEESPIIDIVGVTSVASARARLAEATGESLTTIPTTKSEVINWALEKGYNLVGYSV